MIIARGYIAVVSAIILSSIMSALVFMNSMTIFWTRMEQTDKQSYTANQSLAKSCAYEALLQYTEDPSSIAAGEKILTDPNKYCFVDSIATTSTNQSFAVHASLSSTYSGMVVGTSKDSQTGILTITSWRDITSIPP